MRIGKWLRLMSLAVVLAMLLAALPAAPALAARNIELQDSDDDEIDEGEIGDYFYVVGEDFPESDSGAEPPVYKYVDIYFSSQEADEGDEIDDEVDIYERLKQDEDVDDSGDFSAKVRVPDVLEDGDDEEDVTGGTYYVYVTYGDDDEIREVAEFTVLAAEITLDPDEGIVGSELEITGVDFEADDDLTVEFGSEELDIESGGTVDDDGEVSLTVFIPEGTAGEHTITVTDESDNSAEAEFTVEAAIELSKTSGAAGDSVTVNGTGFGKDADVTVKFDGTEVGDNVTDDYGSFQVTFKLPVKTPGTYDIEAKDEDNNKAEESFTMAAGITLNPTTGNVGSQVTVSGSGFTPGASVNITYVGQAVVKATADSEGRFSATFPVPASQYGAQTVAASDGSNQANATFSVETSPPPIPAPQLPFMDDKAKSEAYFDWDDVNDPSGVTYTLQIASNESFASSTMVLEKKGITASEYTLTKEERLESTDEESPYYWRVQAVDGAQNESGWTTAGSFRVGFTFDFSGWLLYVLLGIAGVMLLAVGFLLGRRSSYM